ncbi:MAG: adenylate/guanylate cyclase domain-containing protein [Desulfobacteraceae bacterium 4572_88]|nr:MAG: adenylate/guanylate cyclase domain-containing protein [Desulfobacteraceae bacterium 4572_88]
MLLSISKKMASCETLDEMLQALVDIITQEVDADRGTIFLKDSETNELYSRVARGNYQHEIRILDDKGVAGDVFTKGMSANVPDAYKDDRFDHSVDEKTGYETKSILCVPIRTLKEEIIGVAQLLNKKHGGAFTEEDEAFVDAVTTQAAVALQSAQIVERMEKARLREKALLDVVADITSEIDLGKILNKVMSQASKMIDSERSTLFLNDDKTNELFSMVGEGLEAISIRLPNSQGIAGTVFTSGKTVNIPYAYSDLRFSPGFDKQTGFFTRSILCVPVNNKEGKTIGVIQLLNKRRGTFTEEDEDNLRTFTGQVSIALENAKLFDDVQNMRNRNEGMLQSMSSAVITLNEDGVIETCNAAGVKILRLSSEAEIIDIRAEEFFTGENEWILDKIKHVDETQKTDEIVDAELEVEIKAAPGNDAEPKKEKASVNLTVLPLFSTEKKTAIIDNEERTIEEQKKLGSMIIIEDISSEKRMKSTMSRYMDPDVAEQLLAEDGEDALGGKSVNATVLFSDIRSFTTMTEELGAQGTVAFLNEYFTIMVECIQNEEGMLDKFIGDAIMAAFGVPMGHDDDEDRGVRTAIAMLSEMFAWNREREAEGKKPVDMGVGLNTGKIVTGNIGSPKRMDYTMIGDGVNLASRLESACKQYAARIIISEFTYEKLRGTYIIREIDRVVVKGQSKPVNIYEVLDYHNKETETFPNMRQVLTLFKEGVDLYRSRNWDNSAEAFREVLNLNPGDKKLCEMYFKRCSYMKENPPGPEWDAVEVKKDK